MYACTSINVIARSLTHELPEHVRHPARPRVPLLAVVPPALVVQLKRYLGGQHGDGGQQIACEGVVAASETTIAEAAVQQLYRR